MASRIVHLSLFFLFLGAAAGAAPSARNGFPDQDRKAYELLMGAYQKQDLKKLKVYEAMFSKKFARSPLKDNATYLLAQLLLEKRQWKQAIPPLNRILKNQALSERWPSALYARGLAYQKLGRKSQAVRQWKVLMKRFPGSRESQKAWVALRLLESEKKVD